MSGRTAATASSTVVAIRPNGTGMPLAAISCLAWYSWIFKAAFRCSGLGRDVFVSPLAYLIEWGTRGE